MSRGWRRALLGVLGLAACLGQAALRPGLQRDQREAGLILAGQGQAGLAADAAVPVLALGAFRGLAVDYLWLRSIALREQGRYFEARQLAEQIGRLQPRLWQVWRYLGQDLAYNVSAAMDEWEVRFRWIQNGIEVLRDQGIRFNPNQPELYLALARVYQDKLGGPTDDFHMRYMEQHAWDMFYTLGDLPLEELAASPPLASLASDDPEVRALVEEGAGLGLDLVGSNAALDVATWRLTDPELIGEKNPDLARLRLDRPELYQFVVERSRSAAWRRLEVCQRAERLRSWYGLEPARMLEHDRTWGPLDWRGVDAMSVYWAAEGLLAAPRGAAYEFRLRQVILQSLRNALRRGRLTFLPDGSTYLGPILELIPRIEGLYLDHVLRAKARADALRAQEQRPRDGGLSEDEAEEAEALLSFLRNQHSARKDFLIEAIELLNDYGRSLEAERLYRVARQDFADEQDFRVSYDDFVIRLQAYRYADPGLFDTQVGTSQLLEGTWTSAYRALALGQDDRFTHLRGSAEAAQRRWERYVRSQLPDDPGARSRLGVNYDAVRERALWRAAQTLTPYLKARLAERLFGRPDPTLLDKAPPELPTPPPRGPGGGQ